MMRPTVKSSEAPSVTSQPASERSNDLSSSQPCPPSLTHQGHPPSSPTFSQSVRRVMTWSSRLALVTRPPLHPQNQPSPLTHTRRFLSSTLYPLLTHMVMPLYLALQSLIHTNVSNLLSYPSHSCEVNDWSSIFVLPPAPRSTFFFCPGR